MTLHAYGPLRRVTEWLPLSRSCRRCGVEHVPPHDGFLASEWWWRGQHVPPHDDGPGSEWWWRGRVYLRAVSCRPRRILE